MDRGRRRLEKVGGHRGHADCAVEKEMKSSEKWGKAAQLGRMSRALGVKMGFAL